MKLWARCVESVGKFSAVSRRDFTLKFDFFAKIQLTGS